MSTHVPDRANAAAKILLDSEALARTLSRIAHEIIERNDDLSRLALVGIHTRGVPLAERLATLIEERSGEEIALGAVDITLPSRRHDPRGRAAGRARDRARFRPARHDLRARRRRPLHRPHDSRRDRDTLRARPAGARSARRPRRSRPPRAADPARLRGKNLPTARSERIQVELEETDGADRILLVSAPEEPK